MAVKLQPFKLLRPADIPQNSGVYFFRNAKKQILYIGKASNLKERLKYYLKPAAGAPAKLAALLNEADAVSWEILGSEAEALIKEAELIKKYNPKYNVLMRDDKNYFNVGFTLENFPKIFITHQKSAGANYIGPFTEGGALRHVLKILRREFPYCTCRALHAHPCLNSKISRCPGYCCNKNFMGKIGSQAKNYAKNISAIRRILSGQNKSLLHELKKRMEKMSSAKKYEEAGKLRDQIRTLEHIFEHRGVIKQDIQSETNKAIKALKILLKSPEINRIETFDVANIHGKFAYGSMAVFEDNAVQKSEYRLFKIKGAGRDDIKMTEEVIGRRLGHPEWLYPQVIIVDGGLAQLGATIKARQLSDEISRRGRAGARVNKFKIRSAEGLKKFQTSVADIKIIALTKNKRHVGDHIFIERSKNPIPLLRLPTSLKNLILMLDSEAHRFAIARYRKTHRAHLFRN